MAGYRDAIYAEIDAMFEKMLGRDYFSDQPLVDPTAYENGALIQPAGYIEDGAVGTGAIIPGSITAPLFDGTAPAVPTGLVLSSDAVLNSDGGSYVRLIITLVQPGDTDLYGSHVEVTANNDGVQPPGSPSPVWDRPHTVFIPKGETKSRIDDVQGATQFWARARSVDILSNFSAYTSTISYTTIGDSIAPPTPTSLSAVIGYRGFGATWSGGDAADLNYYQLRWAAAGAPPDGDDGAWAYAIIKANVAFVGNLTPDLLYWVEVRGVDLSGNASGWTAGVSVIPAKIGAADVTFNSVITNILAANQIDADSIHAGTLTMSPQAAFADGIVVKDINDITIGTWNENGIKIFDSTATQKYIIIDGGSIKFTTDNGATTPTAIDAQGINATAITFGSQSGGHNVVVNSSFELVGTVAAPTTAVFTDNSGTPAWKAANRFTAPANVTEGATDLQVTTMAY